MCTCVRAYVCYDAPSRVFKTVIGREGREAIMVVLESDVTANHGSIIL